MKAIEIKISELLENFLSGSEYNSELANILGHDNFSYILRDFKAEYESIECDEDGATMEQIEEMGKIQSKYVSVLVSTIK